MFTVCVSSFLEYNNGMFCAVYKEVTQKHRKFRKQHSYMYNLRTHIAYYKKGWGKLGALSRISFSSETVVKFQGV